MLVNLGVNYHFELPSAIKVDLAYFTTDSGNYVGNSLDSARYSANLVKSKNPVETDLQEKDMWIARLDQPLSFLNNDALNISVGASYWLSEIYNHKNAQHGSRHAWTLFNKINYKNLGISLTAGELSIKNEDSVSPYTSNFGSFDSEYTIANKGHFYTIDTHYKFNNVMNSLNITPYLVYSGFNKKDSYFDDSMRHIIGASFDYKKVSFYTEYIMSKNDPFIGGTKYSLAAGDDGKWNKLLNFILAYKF